MARDGWGDDDGVDFEDFDDEWEDVDDEWDDDEDDDDDDDDDNDSDNPDDESDDEGGEDFAYEDGYGGMYTASDDDGPEWWKDDMPDEWWDYYDDSYEVEEWEFAIDY